MNRFLNSIASAAFALSAVIYFCDGNAAFGFAAVAVSVLFRIADSLAKIGEKE